MDVYVRILKNGQGHFSVEVEGDNGRLPYNHQGKNLFTRKILARRYGVKPEDINFYIK